MYTEYLRATEIKGNQLRFNGGCHPIVLCYQCW